MLISAFLLFLNFIIFINCQGWSKSDLFKFQDGQIREELVTVQETEGLYFKTDNISLQVSPIEIQTEYADFSFTIAMYRDLFDTEAEIRVDFTQYFAQLAQTNEAVSMFDRIKY